MLKKSTYFCLMYKILIVTILATLAACNNTPTAEQCKVFTNGKFTISIPSKQGLLYFDIYRQDSIQTEVEKNTQDTAVFKLKWVNDCTYSLELIATNIDVQHDVNARKMRTSIIQTSNNYYIYKHTMQNPFVEYTDTAFAQ
jgi:hypothetical protein